VVVWSWKLCVSHWVQVRGTGDDREATHLAANVVRPHRHLRDLALGHLLAVEHEHTDTATCLASRPQPEHSGRATVFRLCETLSPELMFEGSGVLMAVFCARLPALLA